MKNLVKDFIFIGENRWFSNKVEISSFASGTWISSDTNIIYYFYNPTLLVEKFRIRNDVYRKSLIVKDVRNLYIL